MLLKFNLHEEKIVIFYRMGKPTSATRGTRGAKLQGAATKGATGIAELHFITKIKMRHIVRKTAPK